MPFRSSGEYIDPRTFNFQLIVPPTVPPEVTIHKEFGLFLRDQPITLDVGFLGRPEDIKINADGSPTAESLVPYLLNSYSTTIPSLDVNQFVCFHGLPRENNGIPIKYEFVPARDYVRAEFTFGAQDGGERSVEGEYILISYPEVLTLPPKPSAD